MTISDPDFTWRSRQQREEPRPVKRAVRHPASGLGWLWLQQAEREALYHGPPLHHPDPRISGQNPEYTEWAWAQTRNFANQPGYIEQVEARIAELAKSRDSLLASIAGLQAEAEALQADIEKTYGLLT